jgi:hypothetical protein
MEQVQGTVPEPASINYYTVIEPEAHGPKHTHKDVEYPAHALHLGL